MQRNQLLTDGLHTLNEHIYMLKFVSTFYYFKTPIDLLIDLDFLCLTAAFGLFRGDQFLLVVEAGMP